jgi:hypothetical protein
MEKIKIRGLVRSAGWLFIIWGAVVTAKGFWDAFFGEPESNLYSPEKWEFITRHQWLTWSGFEITYGLACMGIALLLWRYAVRLPEYRERPTVNRPPL